MSPTLPEEGHPLNLKKAVSNWRKRVEMTLKSPKIDFLTFKKKNFFCDQLGEWCQNFSFLLPFCKDDLENFDKSILTLKKLCFFFVCFFNTFFTQLEECCVEIWASNYNKYINAQTNKLAKWRNPPEISLKP